MTTQYVCHKIGEKIPLDGTLAHPVWQKAVKTKRFVDVIGGNPGFYDTRAALLYDEDNLYIGFWCEEPFPYATITQRDGLLWFENDLEVFIDGGDCYYEFQLSALNTVYEVFYIWQDVYEKNGWDKKAGFDILRNGAITFGGNHDRTGHYFWRGSHPRGNRWAYLKWDFPGLQTFVHIDGVLNDSTQVSKGWTALVVLPWSGMKELAGSRALPPEEGDSWRFFLGRYETLSMNGEKVSVGWALDPIGSNDNHYPEKFSTIQFTQTTQPR
ncbi:MAG: carbohydrate-binding family 9-like protein [Caldilineaceae bacterium]